MLSPILPPLRLLLQSLSLRHTSTRTAQTALLRHTRPKGPKRRGRLPIYTLPRNADLIVQLIYLLQRQAFRLVDHEVHECYAEEAACEPDEEDLGLEVGVAGAPRERVLMRCFLLVGFSEEGIMERGGEGGREAYQFTR